MRSSNRGLALLRRLRVGVVDLSPLGDHQRVSTPFHHVSVHAVKPEGVGGEVVHGGGVGEAVVQLGPIV